MDEKLEVAIDALRQCAEEFDYLGYPETSQEILNIVALLEEEDANALRM